MSVQKEMEELMNDLQQKERVTQKMIEANLNNVLLEVDKKDKQILFQQEATRAREQVAQYEAILEKQKEMNAYGRIEQQAKEIEDLQEELRGKDSEIDRLKMIINTQKKTEEKQKQERKQMRMSQKGSMLNMSSSLEMDLVCECLHSHSTLYLSLFLSFYITHPHSHTHTHTLSLSFPECHPVAAPSTRAYPHPRTRSS